MKSFYSATPPLSSRKLQPFRYAPKPLLPLRRSHTLPATGPRRSQISERKCGLA
ncbi:MAG: hypothetical protein HOP33_14785 [Verrucomicrobia bacterium]|nr:hypothetical protein [Verrucomicrobiota bacterium]